MVGRRRLARKVDVWPDRVVTFLSTATTKSNVIRDQV
jgi:hypothetical protein